MARLVLFPQSISYAQRADRIKAEGKTSLLHLTLMVLLVVLTTFSTILSANTIVVFGDSISAAYNMPEEKGWVNLLQQTLDDKGYPHTLVNQSISGDTTAGGLSRIDMALEQHKPNLVLLELGANDELRCFSPNLIKKT